MACRTRIGSLRHPKKSQAIGTGHSFANPGIRAANPMRSQMNPNLRIQLILDSRIYANLGLKRDSRESWIRWIRSFANPSNPEFAGFANPTNFKPNSLKMRMQQMWIDTDPRDLQRFESRSCGFAFCESVFAIHANPGANQNAPYFFPTCSKKYLNKMKSVSIPVWSFG